MHIQSSLFKEEPKPSDVVYTPEYVAADIVEWLMPGGVCLDPCKGDGAFYNFLPDGRLWCELELGKNFFDFKDAVDWVIGNPPYSIFEEFLVHSFEISPDVCFLVPTNKIFQRKKIMEIINEFGGIKGMRVYGSGLTIGFPFGFSVGAFHFQKHFRGGQILCLRQHLTSRLCGRKQRAA